MTTEATRHMESGKRRMASLQRLMALEHFTRARELCAEAGDTEGELAAMHWLARSLYEAARPKEAFPLWEEVVARGTRDPEVFDFLIGRYTQSGQHEDALRIWAIRGERLPDATVGAPVLAYVAESLIETGASDEGESIYQRIRAEAARDGRPAAWVWEKKARLLLRHERPAEALGALLEGVHAAGAGGSGGQQPIALIAQAERVARRAGRERPAAYVAGLVELVRTAGLDAARRRLAEDQPAVAATEATRAAAG